MAYAVLAHPRAQRELDKLPARIADGLRAVLLALAESPHSKRFDISPRRAVDGHPPALRLRVGDYRVILGIHDADKEIRIARIGHRSKVYRGLGKDFD